MSNEVNTITDNNNEIIGSAREITSPEENETTAVGMVKTDADSIRLLNELVQLQKKTATRQLIAMTASVIIAVCFAIALIIVVPMVVRMSKEVSAMAASTQDLVKEAEELITQADDSLKGIDSMIENVNKVVVDNTQAVTEAISNIQNIDIDQLNEAIRNLSDAVEPLAKLNNSISSGVSGIFGKVTGNDGN